MVNNVPTTSYDEKRKEEIYRTFYENKGKNAICKHCGTTVYRGNDCCPICAKKLSRVVERPSREKLKDLIRTTPFTTIASSFGVTDNAVRKW